MSSFDKSAAPSSPVFDFRCHSCTLTKRYRFRARIDADRRPVVAYLPRPCRSGTESERDEDCFFEPVGRVVVPVFSHSKDTSEKRLRHPVLSSSARKTDAMHSHDPEVGCSEPFSMSDSRRSDFFCLTRASSSRLQQAIADSR